MSDFRKIHRQAVERLFAQALRLALKAGAMKLGRVAIDGSKVKANASKYNAMSYGRMKEKERELGEEVRRLLAEAERQDAAQDRRYGKDRTAEELPEELRRRESRLRRIRQAKRALEEEARKEGQAVGQEDSKPADKKQYNFTDPQSRIMKGSDGFVQGYNCQIAVEETFQMIVGQAVTEKANDKEQAGQKPREVLADSGYCSEGHLKYLARRRIDGYVATGRHKHAEKRLPCKRGPLPKGATVVERMKRKLQTQVGRRIYAMRKAIVEPVFGQIKQVRGWRQFLLCGLEKVQMEWSLVCLTHNIVKLHRMVCS